MGRLVVLLRKLSDKADIKMLYVYSQVFLGNTNKIIQELLFYHIY